MHRGPFSLLARMDRFPPGYKAQCKETDWKGQVKYDDTYVPVETNVTGLVMGHLQLVKVDWKDLSAGYDSKTGQPHPDCSFERRHSLTSRDQLSDRYQVPQ